MENGSTPRNQNGDDPIENGSLPLSARLLGVGVRGARTVTKATGIDRAVEVAAEDAIVAAVESKAVERAMARVLESERVKRALLEAMDSELVDEVWRRLLASEEAQQLVERIAEAPEVRAAISAQGMGLVEDIGRTVGNIARRLDDRFERIVRRIFFRPPRLLPTDRAGLISRGLAMLIDGVFVNLAFTAFIALVTLLANAFGGNGEGGTSLAIAVGSTAWLSFGAFYLLGFWSLAGQTPGMRFLGIRLNERLPLRRSLRRLIGLGLSVLAFGLGFVGIVFRERRQAWEDRFSASEVLYDERRPEPAPWSSGLDRGAGAVGEVALDQQGGGAAGDHQGDVDGEHDESAERMVDAAGAQSDA